MQSKEIPRENPYPITVFGLCALDPAWGGVVRLIDNNNTDSDNAQNTISPGSCGDLTVRALKKNATVGYWSQSGGFGLIRTSGGLRLARAVFGPQRLRCRPQP